VQLKVELHSHTSDDPMDLIPYSACALIDRAGALGYGALAITLHNKQLDVRPLHDYAAARGIVLLPGIECTIQGKHLLLINFSAAAETITSFDELDALKQKEGGLVIAPHPFYPRSKGLGRLMDRHASLIDAVEVHGFYPRGVNIFNDRARQWAAAHGKALVGNGDVHRFVQLGMTYSIVEADPDARSICDAIRAGRVEVHSRPFGWIRLLALFVDIMVTESRSRRRPRRKTTSDQAGIQA
jgi:predicted metal-dependent phosphoesterase TrpH